MVVKQYKNRWFLSVIFVIGFIFSISISGMAATYVDLNTVIMYGPGVDFTGQDETGTLNTYRIRPAAGEFVYLEFEVQNVGSTTGNVQAIYFQGKDLYSSGAYYEEVNGDTEIKKVIKISTDFFGGLNYNDQYDIQVDIDSDGSGGSTSVTELIGKHTLYKDTAPPVVDLSLGSNSLNPGEIIYVTDKNNVGKDNTAGELSVFIVDESPINQKEFRAGTSYADDLSYSAFIGNTLDEAGSVAWLGTGYDSESYLPPHVTDIDDTSLEFLPLQLRIGAEDSVEPTIQEYYFIWDDKPPTVEAIQADDSTSQSEFGTYESSHPQLKAKITDEMSGVASSDNITVEIKEATASDDEYQYMSIIDYDYEDPATTGVDPVGTVTFVPYNSLPEGNYEVRISATDSAVYTGGARNTVEQRFPLHIDASTPSVNNVVLNGEVFDTEEGSQQVIVGRDRLQLQFNVHYAKEVRIELKDADGTVYSTLKTDLKETETNLIPVDILKELLGQTEAEGGDYTLNIIADDTDISDTAPAGEELTPKEIIKDSDGTGVNQRICKSYDFAVDGNPPTVNNLMYQDEIITDANYQNKIINTATPILELELDDDLSKIFTKDIEITIDGILAGVRNYNQNLDDPQKPGLVKFQPNIPLEPGTHTIKVIAKDELGNSTEALLEAERTFIFKTDNIANGITFNLTQGDRLNINQSSAIEITLPTEKEINTSTLKVLINGKEVISGGGSVEDSESVERDYDVLFFPSKDNIDRIILFARRPLPIGRNRLQVEIKDQYDNVTTNYVDFVVENYRKGFGFGRLLINN